MKAITVMLLGLVACGTPPDEPYTAVTFAAECVGLDGDVPPITLEPRPAGEYLTLGEWTDVKGTFGPNGITLLVWPGWRWSDTSLVAEMAHAAHGDPDHLNARIWGSRGTVELCVRALLGTELDTEVMP